MPGQDDTREYSTVDLRKNLGQALGRAHFQGEIVRISHHGKPYAGVVSEEYVQFLESVRKIVLSKGMSIVDIVPLIEQAVTDRDVEVDTTEARRGLKVAS